VRRIFVSGDPPSGSQWLPEASSLHYVGRVLRADKGDLFQGFGANSSSYRLEWVSVGEGFRVLERIPALKKNGVTLSLAAALPKGPKWDLILRQCTEAGVAAFFPLLTQHTLIRLRPEEYEGKRSRWEKIIRESCRQCGRDDIPFLDVPRPWSEWIPSLEAFDLKLLLHPDGGESLKKVLESHPDARRVLLLTGPEGGWSDQEVREAQGVSARSVGLPTPVLRAETAPLAAASMVRFHYSG
jgi:16S rRNA (uracil1498-N3)-methyltransferase